MTYLSTQQRLKSVKIARYLVETGRNKKYGIANMVGFKSKIIPEDVYNEMLNRVTNSSDIICDSKHCIFVPFEIFHNMCAENLAYRDESTLWMSIEPKVSDDITLKLYDTKKDIMNINRYIQSISEKSKISKSDETILKTSFSLEMNKCHCGMYEKRIVQILPLHSANTDHIYMSENEYFNIKKCFSTSSVNDNFTLKLCPIMSQSFAPQIAEKAVIQRINTPNVIETDLIDLLLSNYFRTPKYLHKDDYFEIPLVEKYAGHLYFKYLKVIKLQEKVYFQCVEIKATSLNKNKDCANTAFLRKKPESINIGYFVIKGETDLIQEQNFSSFIPPIECYPLPLTDSSREFFDIDTSFINSCPFGIDKYLEDIKLSINPFLLENKVNPLRTELKCVIQSIFLLRGDTGSGYEIIARRLATHLGMHFFSMSCRQLTASTAKQTEAKIDALFQRAKTCAPVIVHLQHFDAFGLDSENNEDTRIVESFVKKLNDLYENFTKFPVIIICSCNSSTELKPNILRIFLEEFHIKNPDKNERLEFLKWMMLVNNVVLCDNDFQPILHTDEPIVSLDNEILVPKMLPSSKNIVSNVENTTIAAVNLDISYKKHDSRRKSKKGVGKKSKNLSNASQADTNKMNFDNSVIEMVGLEERLVSNMLTNMTKVADENKSKIDNLTIKESENDPTVENSCANTVVTTKNLKCVLKMNSKLIHLLEMASSKTETFIYGDLDTLTRLSLINGFLNQKKKFKEKFFQDKDVICNEPQIGLVREKDFEEAIESLRLMKSNKFTSLRIPNVQWEDIGGLEDLKKEIVRTIELPLKFPHLLANIGLRRSGLLLWGPPGCGKTLVARAIASQLQATFLSVKGPELLDMYVGQSEKNVRDMFAAARASSPCVIFLDEAEAAAAARGASGDSGGVADRLVSQLLAELDGVAASQNDAQSSPVIVVAATNRPDLVEPALLRPGRLDRLLYVGPYEGLTNKHRVLKASCRGYNLQESVDLEDVCRQLPDKCTGADLAAVVNRARKLALARAVRKAEEGSIASNLLTEKDIIILENDFEKAVLDFVPSISANEMYYYESLKSKLL